MPRTPRPKVQTFTLCGDRYFGLRADGTAADFSTPVLRVPADVAHLVKVEWPKPTAEARRGLQRAQETALADAA